MSTRRLGLFNKPSGGGYLLDTYTGAAAAYSFRKLKTGVTYTCQLLRDSDSATTDLELYASGSIDLNSPVSAGGTLGTWSSGTQARINIWYDQSGNGIDVSGSTRPRITLNGALTVDNGLVAAFFDNHFLRYTGTLGDLSMGGTNPKSCFIVANPDVNNTWLTGIGNASTGGSGNLFDITSEIGVRVNGGNEIYNSSATAQSLITSIFPTGGSNVTDNNAWKDGLSLGVSSSASVTVNTVDSDLAIGTGTWSGSDKFNGLIQEVIWFASDQTSNRSSIESDINAHYSIF